MPARWLILWLPTSRSVWSARRLFSSLPENAFAGHPHAVAGSLSHGASSGREPPSPPGPYRAKRMECAQLAAAFETQPRPNAPPSRCAL